MDFKFDKGTAGDTAATQGQQDKGRQTILLIVLLLLLGGFGYLYFFTGLIRPQEQPAQPPSSPQILKQPLPPREGTPAPLPVAAAPASTVAPAAAAKPAVPGKAPATTAAPKPAPKPASTPVVPASLAAPKKPVQPAASPTGRKPAAGVVKQALPAVAPAKKGEPVKPVARVRGVAHKQAAKKTARAETSVKRPLRVKAGGPWILVVGSYRLEERLAADMARVKELGLNPVMTTGRRRVSTMYRLKYGEYSDRIASQQAVSQLKKQTGDGFAIPSGGNYEVFAGSYAVLAGAQAEQRHLAAAGITVTIKKVQVGVPTRQLTAGTFTDRAAAEAALRRLKQAGIGTPTLE